MAFLLLWADYSSDFQLLRPSFSFLSPTRYDLSVWASWATASEFCLTEFPKICDQICVSSFDRNRLKMPSDGVAEDGSEVTAKMATYHLRATIDTSRWSRLRGFHVFRHCFASILALGGVDQRLIDEWMGHQTEEMRRRYRHLFPDQQREALVSVFGAPKCSEASQMSILLPA